MATNLTDRQRRMMQRNHRQFRKWIYSAYFNNVEWLSDSAMEAWETTPYRYKHKLSRRRGTPWYRHRDAWKLELKKWGWYEPSPNDPTLTNSEFESALYREAEKVLLGDCK